MFNWGIPRSEPFVCDDGILGEGGGVDPKSPHGKLGSTTHQAIKQCLLTVLLPKHMWISTVYISKKTP